MVVLASLSRWLNRINAFLLAAWLGMVTAHWPGRAGMPPWRVPPLDKPAWVAGLDTLGDRWFGDEPGPARPGDAGAVQPAAASPASGAAADRRSGAGDASTKDRQGGAKGAGSGGAATAAGKPSSSGLSSIPPGRRWSRPVETEAVVTSLFGPRDGRWHHGVDLAVPAGTPVRAVWSGVVRQAGWRGEYGLAVEVAHPGGWATLYGHLSSVAVEPGQRVDKGQALGRVGATGNATGPHLHLEVRGEGGFFDPLAWLDPRWYRPAPALSDDLGAGDAGSGGARGGP